MSARNRILVLGLCGLVGWFHVWTARSSAEPWNFGAEQNDYYNLLIDGWLDGQLNMKVEVPEALRRAPNPYDPEQRPPGGLHDASFYRGKYYLYFGAAPVVTLMLPFRVLTGVDLPMAAAILVFAYGGFVVSTVLWLQVWRRYFPDARIWHVLLGMVVLGSANMALVLVRRANIWELPLSSGYFFAMAALLAIFASLHAGRRRLRWLALGSLALGLAVASRPTYLFAAGALLMPVIGSWRATTWAERRRSLIAATLPLACVGIALAAHNYARFGSPVEFGTKYMLGGANEAQARYFSPGYFAYNIDRYFLRAPAWLRYFPFLHQPEPGAMPKGYYGVEEVYGILPGFLVLWFVPFAPLAWRDRDPESRRRIRAWLAAAALLALGPAVMLCGFWAAMARYQIDFLPALVLLGTIGTLAVDRYLQPRARTGRRIGQAMMIGAMVGSIFFGVMQSLALYGNLRRLSPRSYARVALAFNAPVSLWEKLMGAEAGPLELDVKFGQRGDGRREPLVSTGLPGKQDRVLVEYDADGLRFVCLHDGSAERTSRPMQGEPGKSYRVRIEMGSLYPPEEHPYFSGRSARERVGLARTWRIQVDDAVVLNSYQRFHPASAATLRIGRDAAPRTGETAFSGEILKKQRVMPAGPSSDHAFADAPEDFRAVRMTLTRPAFSGGAREPLLAVGDTGHGDFVFIEYLDARRVRFGFDHWGKPTRFSEPVEVPAQEAHVIEIRLGSFGREAAAQREAIGPVSVSVDGRLIWDFATKLYPIESEDIFVGRNPIGGTSAATSFSGVISAVEWIPDPTPRK